MLPQFHYIQEDSRTHLTQTQHFQIKMSTKGRKDCSHRPKMASTRFQDSNHYKTTRQKFNDPSITQRMVRVHITIMHQIVSSLMMSHLLMKNPFQAFQGILQRLCQSFILITKWNTRKILRNKTFYRRIFTILRSIIYWPPIYRIHRSKDQT